MTKPTPIPNKRQRELRAARRKREGDKRNLLAKQDGCAEGRIAGYTFQQLADQYGYAQPSGAQRATEAAYRRWGGEASEAARELELARLDRLQRSVWKDAVGGDMEKMRVILGIIDRRCRILGLEVPVKVDITARIIEVAEAMGIDPQDAIAEAESYIKGR